jgi:hypothetical protein
MSQIEEIIVELIESRIADYDFGRIIDDAISYNDDVQGHESRIDDLENIAVATHDDVESTLTEFGDRIDELAELVRLSSVTAAAADNTPANQIDLIMPRNPLVLGYSSMDNLREYVTATLAGTGQSEELLLEMVFATARRIIDKELGIGRRVIKV